MRHLIIIAAASVLIACGGPQPATEATKPATQATATQAPAAATKPAAAAATPTAMAASPTVAAPAAAASPTSAPAGTPSAAATSIPPSSAAGGTLPADFAGNSVSVEVIEAFRAAGLEVGEIIQLTRDDLNMAPYLTDDMARFLIPSACDDAECGGRVFATDSAAEAEQLTAYFRALSESDPSHVFTREVNGKHVVVQINGEVPDDKAAQYEQVLESI